MIHAQFVFGEYGEVPEVIEAEEVVSVASAAQVDARNPKILSMLSFRIAKEETLMKMSANMSIQSTACML
jgi:hypothetical protein